MWTNIKISRKMTKCQKIHVWQFSVSGPRKISSGRRSDNIDASGLPNSSSESLCPKVFEEHVKNSETLKIGGPSPLQSQLIGNRETEKSSFSGSFLEEILVLTDFDQMLTPPLIYIVGKLCSWAFTWYFWKNISWILRQNFCNSSGKLSLHYIT